MKKQAMILMLAVAGVLGADVKAADAATVCGLIRGFPMIGIDGAHEKLTLVTTNRTLQDRLIRAVGGYACVVGHKTDRVYTGFVVYQLITDEL